MRRKEFSHLVVIKGQPRSPAAQGIGRDVHLAADDAGLHLDSPIAPVAESRQDVVQICHEKERNGCVAAQILVQHKVGSLLVKVAILQTYESIARPVEVVGTGRNPFHAIDYQINVIQLRISSWQEISRNATRAAIQYGGELGP